MIKAKVESIEPLTDSIIKLILAPKKFIDYEAGQYLKVKVGKELMAYSIANAPLGSHKYELHVRHAPANLSNQCLFSEIKEKGALSISLPFGKCFLSQLNEKKDIIF